MDKEIKMEIEFKDIVDLQRLYMEIFEEEYGFPVDNHIVNNKEKAVQKILDRITSDNNKQREIWYIIQTQSWNKQDNTYKPICNSLRNIGFQIKNSEDKEVE